MSMSDGQIDKLDRESAHGKPGGPLSPEQRERKQKQFIKAFSVSGNILYSCKSAKISRQTYYTWRDTDEAFQAMLKDAREDANDVLEYAAQERAVQGILEPIVSQGQLVYEYEPMLDDEGKPMFSDNGKPLMKRGKQVMKRVYSDSLLQMLLKANIPTKYREKSSIEMSGPNGGPIQTQRNTDLQHLTDDELDLIEQTLLHAKERNG